MAEVYTGTKFKTVFANQEPSKDRRLNELMQWCRRFAELGLASGGVGNLSIRTPKGFLISRTGSDLAKITAEEFVEVLKVDIAQRELTASGLFEPSSESMMHSAIYERRKDINAVFHGHSAEILNVAERLELPMTEKEHPYGTPELAKEIIKILGKEKFLIIRNHGFVSLGSDMEEAGQYSGLVLARALETA